MKFDCSEVSRLDLRAHRAFRGNIAFNYPWPGMSLVSVRLVWVAYSEGGFISEFIHNYFILILIFYLQFYFMLGFFSFPFIFIFPFLQYSHSPPHRLSIDTHG